MRETLKSKCFTWNKRAISVKLRLFRKKCKRFTWNIYKEWWKTLERSQRQDHKKKKKTQKTLRKHAKSKKTANEKRKNGLELKKKTCKKQWNCQRKRKNYLKTQKEGIVALLIRFFCALQAKTASRRLDNSLFGAFHVKQSRNVGGVFWFERNMKKLHILELLIICFGSVDVFFDEFCEILLRFSVFLPLRCAKT